MIDPQDFLVTYGLHNFVSHTKTNNRHVFFIMGSESRKMICHAERLIAGCFNENAETQVV
jgi:hypothetical protein